MRRAKIVATIGPSSDSPEVIGHLLDAGMDVARLNFSHGTHADHARRIKLLRDLAAERDIPLALLADLQGPKIRTGDLERGEPVQLIHGQRFTITTNDVAGTAERVSTTYSALPSDVRIGDRILLSDGLIELRVIDTTATEVHTEVIYGGELRQKQGINLPGVNVSAPSLTDKDTVDLTFALEQGVDYVALSFVRRAADIDTIKTLIANAGKTTPVVAKIEKPEALDDLDAILEATDAVMVARGDLGVEMPAEQVPLVQKRLIEVARDLGRPVITATQMLQSMIDNPRPTRAEVSDVANAILDGTSAVMLSGETASGLYPVQAVETMSRIAQTAEASGRMRVRAAALEHDIRHTDLARAISAAVLAIVNAEAVRAIVAFTNTGTSARLVSRLRPRVPIFAFTPSEETYHRANLYWGVCPVLCKYVDRLDDLGDIVNEVLLARGAAQPGDRIVVTGGHPIAARGNTNFVKVLELR